MLADSKNSYVPNFEVYLGKKDRIGREKGFGYGVVWHLTEEYRNKWHHIYMDNFFTSIELFKDLFNEQTYGCGTLHTNRKHYPNALKGLKLRRGEIRVCQSKNVVFTHWKDKKDVVVLSTNCNPVDDVRIAPAEIAECVKPPVVQLYNASMGGVDRSDQYRSYYPTGRKALKWWKYIMWFLDNIAVCDSFILQKISL